MEGMGKWEDSEGYDFGDYNTTMTTILANEINMLSGFSQIEITCIV